MIPCRRLYVLCASSILLLVGLLGVAGCTTASQPADQPAAPSALVLYDWEDDIPQSVLDAFHAETGIQVALKPYESTEEAVTNLSAGKSYDVMVIENRHIPALIAARLLAKLDLSAIPNIRNISPNFRDLIYDPGNSHSVPYSWGTSGIVMRSDLVQPPVTHWSDLWQPRFRGKVAFWRGQGREAIGLTLKSLGYSANSETPAELEAALVRLLELRPHILFVEDFDKLTAATLLASGKAVVAQGYAYDALQGRTKNTPISYVLPEEGGLLWGDNYVVPARSEQRATAERFINFLLRPEISAQIVNQNFFSLANTAVKPLVDPALADDPLVFPPDDQMHGIEIVMPLSSEGEKLYADIWRRFLENGQ